MSALDISDSSLSTEVAKVSYSVGEKLLNIKEFITMEISKGELKIHQDLGNFHEENSKIEGCVNSMVEEFRACQSDLRKKSLEGINEIKEDFERLGSIIRNQDQSKVELEKVKESSETLKEQLQELKTTLIEKNFSVENLEKALNAAEDYKSQLEDSNKIKDSEVERLKLILDKKESQAKTMDEKIEKCKTNCESKMRTQLEIHSFIAEERDSFKQIASEMKVTQELLEAKIAEGSKILEERKSIEIQLRDNERNLLARLELLETQNKDFQRKLDNASELKLERPIDIEGHESINDLELTFSSAVIPKSSSIPSLVPKFNAKNTKKIAPNIISQNKIAAKDKILQVSTGPFQPALDLKTQNKSSLKVKRKKKLLDQEDEIESMFDEFDFDQLDNQFPTLPKRYTKRKKGKT
ncbi:hypothetical protein WICMUC_003053 [Wickerhamomyces mucosus]|uniref:Uncharacterized protein n=1 Tax=Wickerhamomyces mucosus TaxID=1378264 RepID=A0A9P8PNR3_9ASCO|nr:hypothetical protein WICMUC_003053 [Wickerhamomyces mucosus]